MTTSAGTCMQSPSPAIAALLLAIAACLALAAPVPALADDERPQAFGVPVALTDEGGALLAGATLAVSDASGAAVASWATEGDTPVNVDLVAGQYALSEVAPPYGYDGTEPIPFEVDADGALSGAIPGTVVDGTLTVVNSPTPPNVYRVAVSKVDAQSGEPLAGAQLQILDENGRQVTVWTSGLQAHIAILAPGSYSLHELAAPDGYERTADLPFTVKDDGSATSGIARAVANGTLVSRASRRQTNAAVVSVPVRTIDAADAQPVSGAQLKVIDANGAIVDAWTTDGTDASHALLLATGTYTLIEPIAARGHERAEDIPFTVSAEGISSPVTGAAAGGVLTVRNVPAEPAEMIASAGDGTDLRAVLAGCMTGAGCIAAGASLLGRPLRKQGSRPLHRL